MSRITTGIMSSDTDQWFTPPSLVNDIKVHHDIHEFTLDAAADKQNAKAKTFYTKDDDALQCEWFGDVWLNPPYGRVIGDFTRKAVQEVNDQRAQSVSLLVPARTDTRWFQELVTSPYCAKVHFLKGRVKFINPQKGGDQSAPFPSAIVLLERGAYTREPEITFGSL